MKAWLNLRYTVPDRLRAFVSGIERHGYKAEIGLPDRIGPKDLFLSWNRIRQGDVVARKFEERLQPVLIAENAAWGNDFLGGHWYSLAMNYHNTAGRFPIWDERRWDRLGVELEPFRNEGETVILPQRGIGSPPVKMPEGWTDRAFSKYKGRVRAHPGTKPYKPLRDDLANAGRVITWGSGAAIKARMWGIPVISEYPDWIGRCENTESGRLDMLRQLACAQWRLDEIESGEAFACLLCA